MGIKNNIHAHYGNDTSMKVTHENNKKRLEFIFLSVVSPKCILKAHL